MDIRKQTNVLIVEDDAISAENLKESLEYRDFNIVDVCNTADDAVNSARRTMPDVVLMDIRLIGKTDGIEAGKIIGRELDIPVIYVTAFSDEETVARARDTVPYGFISKPYRIIDVINAIKMAFHVHQSRKKEKEAEIEMASLKKGAEAKSNALNYTGHEIRNRLQLIFGSIQLMMQTPLEPNLKKRANRVMDAADDINKLCNDMLDLSKIEIDELKLEKIEFSLQKILENACDNYETQAKNKNILLKSAINSDVPSCLKGDPTRLTQILINLLGNAVKFTEKGSCEISVSLNPGFASAQSLSDHKVSLLFTVKDTGSGIPAEKLGYIFDPFKQADISTTRQFGGTGLGLSIAKKLVELMNGEIKVESIVGQGTSFTFTAIFEVVRSI